MFGIYSTYLIFFKGVRITFLSSELPFVDNDSDFGFWLNILMQSFLAILGLVACFTIEIGVSLILNTIIAIPHLMHVDLDALETELKLNGQSCCGNATSKCVYENARQREVFIYHNLTSIAIFLIYQCIHS